MKKKLIFIIIIGFLLILSLFLILNFSNVFCKKVNLNIFFNSHPTGIFYSPESDKISQYDTEVCIGRNFSISRGGIVYKSDSLLGNYRVVFEDGQYYLIKPSFMRSSVDEIGNKILFNNKINLIGSSVTDSIVILNLTLKTI